MFYLQAVLVNNNSASERACPAWEPWRVEGPWDVRRGLQSDRNPTSTPPPVVCLPSQVVNHWPLHTFGANTTAQILENTPVFKAAFDALEDWVSPRCCGC